MTNYKYEILETNFERFLEWISSEAYTRYTGKQPSRTGILETINRNSKRNKVSLLRRGIDDNAISKDPYLVSKYSKIPFGNWYYLHQASATDENNLEPRTIVNLHHDQYGSFNAKGNHPLYLLEQYLYFNPTQNQYGSVNGLKGLGVESNINDVEWGTIKLFSVSRCLLFAHVSRLLQIRDKVNQGIARFELLNADNEAVLRNGITEESNTHNHKIKVTNRLGVLPRRKDMEENIASSNGSHMYSRTNEDGTFSDQFSMSPDPDDIAALFEHLDVEVGEGAEASAQRGTYVVMSPELQKAKRAYGKPNEVCFTEDDEFYRGVLTIRNKKTQSLVTIYPEAQKAYQRIKSLASANIAKIVSNEEINHEYFDRTTSYMNENPDLIGKIDEANVETTCNMTVVFAEGSDDFIYMHAPELHGTNPKKKDIEKFFEDPKNQRNALNYFRDFDKGRLSAQLHTADCHLQISEDIGNVEVLLSRTYKIELPENCLTSVVQRFNVNNEKTLIFKDEDGFHPLDTPLAYQVICTECENNMSPYDYMNGEILLEAPERHEDWYCSCCTHRTKIEKTEWETNSNTKIYSFKSQYRTAKEITLKGINFNDLESGIPLEIEVSTRAKGCRVVDPTGAKAFTMITGDEFLGTISGKIWNPTTQTYKEIKDLKVDAVIPFGAFKGKESGQIVSFLEMCNALLGTKICPDQIYKQFLELNNFDENVTSNDTAEQLTELANEIYDKSELTHTRKVFVASDEICKGTSFGQFETKTFYSSKKEFRFGMINLGVTEVNDEFLKYKNEHSPMKISVMNAYSYNVLGLQKIHDVIRAASFVSLQDPQTQRIAEHMFRAYSFNPTDKHIEFDPHELKSLPKMVFDHNPTKKEWITIVENYPIFNKERNPHGMVVNVDETFQNCIIGGGLVIPPADVLLSNFFVKERHGGKLRIHDTLLKIIEILSYMGSRPEKVKQTWLYKYRKAILKVFEGKQGLVARLSTYIGKGIQGKEVGCGLIPEGVVIIAQKDYWKDTFKDHCKYNPDYTATMSKGIKYYEQFLYDLRHGVISVYAKSNRDPNIWYEQNLNVVQVWHPERADQHFKENYGISFYDYAPDFKMNDDNQGGIISNVMDMLALYMSDSDGDMRRLFHCMKPEVQTELAKLWGEMQNYNLFYNDKYPAIRTLTEVNEWWRFEYVLSEAIGNISWSNEWRMSLAPLHKKDRRQAMLAAVHAKRSIGTITVSKWMIEIISAYLVGKNQIAHDDMLRICAFYQTIITQNGCIRSVKHVADALNRMTHDEIALNKMPVPHTMNGEKTIEVLPQEKLVILMKHYGYPESTIDAFKKVIKFWVDNAKVDPKKKIIDRKEATIYAQMIRSYSTIMHGNKSGLLSHQNMFNALRIPDAKHVILYPMFKPIIDMINDIDDKYHEAESILKAAGMHS